jgi:hypothetical protein
MRGTYVINEAAKVMKNQQMERIPDDESDPRRLQGAKRLVKKAKTSKTRAIK